ncbi:MAG: HAMP domain-containing protein [Endomicrobiales bacterium]|nr:HAMP domain-containing protein [Endomicrobiales bacterium]
MIQKIRVGLPVKILLSVSILIILTSLSLTWFFIKNQIVQVRAALEDRCSMMARNLAYNSEFGVLTTNKNFLKKLNEIVTKEQDILYSLVYDKNGRIMALAEITQARNLYREIEPYLSYKFPQIRNAPSSSPAQKMNDILKFSYISKSGESIHDVISPITIRRIVKEDDVAFMGALDQSEGTEEIIGFARVGISLERMNRQIKDITKGVILLTVLVVVVGILLSFILVRIIIKPIKQLALGTQKIASGDLNYYVDVESNDEIGELAEKFNLMASDLRRYIRELNKEKEDLFRTKHVLEQRTKELEESLIKIKNIQQELIRSEKFATVGRLASSIAHELRNPLASLKNISYYLTRFASQQMDEKAKKMVEMLATDITRSNKIVTDLLDFAHIRKLNRMAVEIDDFINKFLENVNLDNNIKLVKHLEKVKVVLDPDRLNQILINLTANALDAMPDGGTLTLTAKRADRNLIIEISDTGRGMDEETIEHIFDPLFSTKTKGLGLSLAIVKEIIDTHNGTIEVTSKKEKGTTFEITLPL